jgi:hypothetical protein
MKRFLFIFIAVAAVLASCNNYETYGDKKEKERNAIEKFISDRSITIISEDQFKSQGMKTNVDRNEYVKLNKNGVYLQIVREGCGDIVKDGETTNLICRFSEYNILQDTMQVRNDRSPSIPDIMYVSRTGSNYTAAFVSGVMKSTYSAVVPPGWLVPLTYIHVGRPQSLNDEVAKVRIIVPHAQGHAVASSNVTPYHYEITYEKEI